jgi:large subunit ribosomal protein L23
MTIDNILNFKDPHDVLLGPVVSEKSFELADQGKYTFKVQKTANKTEIKQAVQTIFGVKVLSVNTLNRKGKLLRTRFGYGKRNDEKRAIVAIEKGQTIDVFGTEQVG